MEFVPRSCSTARDVSGGVRVGNADLPIRSVRLSTDGLHIAAEGQDCCDALGPPARRHTAARHSPWRRRPGPAVCRHPAAPACPIAGHAAGRPAPWPPRSPRPSGRDMPAPGSPRGRPGGRLSGPARRQSGETGPRCPPAAAPRPPAAPLPRRHLSCAKSDAGVCRGKLPL